MNNKEQKADLLPSASIAQSNMLAEGVFVGKKRAKELTRKLTDVFFDEIRKMSDNELRAVIKRCEGFSQTNCGWSEYWMKDIIIKVAKDYLQWKKEKRRKK